MNKAELASLSRSAKLERHLVYFTKGEPLKARPST